MRHWQGHLGEELAWASSHHTWAATEASPAHTPDKHTHTRQAVSESDVRHVPAATSAFLQRQEHSTRGQTPHLTHTAWGPWRGHLRALPHLQRPRLSPHRTLAGCNAPATNMCHMAPEAHSQAAQPQQCAHRQRGPGRAPANGMTTAAYHRRHGHHNSSAPTGSVAVAALTGGKAPSAAGDGLPFTPGCGASKLGLLLLWASKLPSCTRRPKGDRQECVRSEPGQSVHMLAHRQHMTHCESLGAAFHAPQPLALLNHTCGTCCPRLCGVTFTGQSRGVGTPYTQGPGWPKGRQARHPTRVRAGLVCATK